MRGCVRAGAKLHSRDTMGKSDTEAILILTETQAQKSSACTAGWKEKLGPQSRVGAIHGPAGKASVQEVACKVRRPQP